MNCSDIENKVGEWITSLEENGITKQTQVLYYFKIKGGSTSDKIQKLIADSKKKHKTSHKQLQKISFIYNKSTKGKPGLLNMINLPLP